MSLCNILRGVVSRTSKKKAKNRKLVGTCLGGVFDTKLVSKHFQKHYNLVYPRHKTVRFMIESSIIHSLLGDWDHINKDIPSNNGPEYGTQKKQCDGSRLKITKTYLVDAQF